MFFVHSKLICVYICITKRQLTLNSFMSKVRKVVGSEFAGFKVVKIMTETEVEIKLHNKFSLHKHYTM